MKTPPTPTNDPPPINDRDPAVVLRSHVSYWQGAARLWTELGEEIKAAECRGVATGIEAALDVLGKVIAQPPADLLGPAEAAEYLGITRSSLRVYVARGLIKGWLVNGTRMFSKAELDAVKAARKRPRKET